MNILRIEKQVKDFKEELTRANTTYLATCADAKTHFIEHEFKEALKELSIESGVILTETKVSDDEWCLLVGIPLIVGQHGINEEIVLNVELFTCTDPGLYRGDSNEFLFTSLGFEQVVYQMRKCSRSIDALFNNLLKLYRLKKEVLLSYSTVDN